MARKNKIDWVWIAVLLGCAIFVGNQYFMATESAEQIVIRHAEQRAKEKNAFHSTEGNPERLSQVDAFVKFISENNPDQTEVIDNSYAKDAFNYLIEALENVVDEAEVDKLKTQFEAFENAGEGDILTQFKHMIVAATGVIESIQIDSGDNEGNVKNHLELLKKDARAINTGAPLEKQSELLEDYFGQAASILEAVEKSV